MKEAFESTNKQRAILERIYAANAVVEEYLAKGFTLTIRQLHYQMVSRKIYANTQANYKQLANDIRDGRMIGVIDWDAIEDRGRVAHTAVGFGSVPKAIDAITRCYRLDRTEGQRERIEIMSEKDAVSGILRPLADKYGITLVINKGYPSITALYECKERYIADGRPVHCLYCGDMDPSGIDMPFGIEDTLNRMLKAGDGPEFKLSRVALNFDQTEGLSPDPVKVKDKRSEMFIKMYGETCFELDALGPERLVNIFEVCLSTMVDKRIYDDVLKKEKEDKDRLEAFAKTFKA